MIRIETIAEFDAEGRFTVTGKSTVAVSPGSHRVTLEVEEPQVQSTQSAIVNEDGLFLLNVESQDDADLGIVRLIEADREARLQQLLGGGHG